MTSWSARTTYQGRAINQGTNQIMAALNKMVRTPQFGGERENVTMVQGGYNKGGVAASAGTHDGGGAFDLTAWNWANRVRALRILGCAAFHRPYNWDNRRGGAHIHTVVVGDGTASAGAKQQVSAYLAGRNGLANNAKDADKRPAVLPILFHLDGDLSPRYAKVACGVYAEPNASGTALTVATVGESFTPVAVVNVGGDYWFVTADGRCGFEGNFTTDAGSCPPPLEPAPPLEPTPEPTPPTDPEPGAPPMSGYFRMLSYNQYAMQYTNNVRAIGPQQAVFDDAKPSIALVTEVNRDGDHERWMKIFGGWPKVYSIRAAANNHIYFLQDTWELVDTVMKRLGSVVPKNGFNQNRAATFATLRHKQHGFIQSFAVTHLASTSAGYTSTEADLSRKKEARELMRLVNSQVLPDWDPSSAVIGADLNTSATSAGMPRTIISDTHGFLRDHGIDVGDANIASHQGWPNPKTWRKGSWIDDIASGPGIRLHNARLITSTKGASDHLALCATFYRNAK